MKRFQGLVAAAAITLVLALGMVVIGVDAASNTNTAPILSSPAQASLASALASQAQADQSQAQIAQLQSLIKQYQDREKQYQSEIQSLSQKLNDASAQTDQLQQILMALQQRGIIQITRDGRIFVNGG